MRMVPCHIKLLIAVCACYSKWPQGRCGIQRHHLLHERPVHRRPRLQSGEKLSVSMPMRCCSFAPRKCAQCVESLTLSTHISAFQ